MIQRLLDNHGVFFDQIGGFYYTYEVAASDKIWGIVLAIPVLILGFLILYIFDRDN